MCAYMIDLPDQRIWVMPQYLHDKWPFGALEITGSSALRTIWCTGQNLPVAIQPINRNGFHNFKMTLKKKNNKWSIKRRGRRRSKKKKKKKKRKSRGKDTETIHVWPTKPKIFTVWPLTETFANPCLVNSVTSTTKESPVFNFALYSVFLLLFLNWAKRTWIFLLGACCLH